MDLKKGEGQVNKSKRKVNRLGDEQIAQRESDKKKKTISDFFMPIPATGMRDSLLVCLIFV
ncbi:hypothetical protein DPMN_052921 [Dreissena polymorpha]|uniref:Uncharacterized protein n=1 Tax=Dreissena polymorpha TaxID=45954 RepID=A0A9D4CM19_DREPO|nr:hypothetical protein DPMN_052921 [Dreissena polymorpha]